MELLIPCMKCDVIKQMADLIFCYFSVDSSFVCLFMSYAGFTLFKSILVPLVKVKMFQKLFYTNMCWNLAESVGSREH